MAEPNQPVQRKVRHAYMISTLSIALVLFLLGGVGYLIVAALGATQQLKSVTVYVMLEDSISNESREGLHRKLEQHSLVKKVVFIPKDEAAAEYMIHQHGEDFQEFLGFNPLPDAYGVTLDPRAAEEERLPSFEQEVMRWDGVDEVVYQRNTIAQITSNINKFNTVLLFFGATLLIISLILLNNTIRMAILSKRYVINTMKLVGATPGFIMRPFLWSSVRQGVYAGLISWVMLALLIMGLHEGLPEVSFLEDRLWLVMIFGAMLLGGVLISVTFTWISVRKFLKLNSNSIYLY